MTTPTPIAIPTTNTTARAALLDAAGGLGALVWWSLTDTRITPDRLRAILAAEGDDPSRVPDIEQGAAIRRATRGWAQGRGNADRFRAEIAAESGSVLTIGILRREKPAHDEVRWVQVDQLSFDAAAGVWTATGSSPEAAAFRAEADEARTHLDHDWIRPNLLLRGLTEAQSVCLRDRGGVYFVPRQHEETLARLVRIVAKIGSCHVDVVHAQATASSQTSIAAGATSAMREDLSGLIDRIRGWAESARKVSDGSAATVLSELSELSSKASLYSDALQISMDDLTSAIEAAKDEARRVISGSARAPAPAAPIARGERKLFAADGLVFSTRGRIATGRMTEDAFILLAGSAVASGTDGTGILASDETYKSPSGAAARVAGHSVNGWSAWRLGGVPIAELAASRASEAPAPAPEAPAPEAPAPEAPAPEAPEAPEVEVVIVPEAPEVVIVPDGEEVGDLRERLAAMTPAEIRAKYELAFGPANGRSKAAMISRIVNAAT